MNGTDIFKHIQYFLKKKNFFFAYKIFIFSDAMDAVGKFKLQYAIKLKNFILQKIILNILQT